MLNNSISNGVHFLKSKTFNYIWRKIFRIDFMNDNGEWMLTTFRFLLIRQTGIKKNLRLNSEGFLIVFVELLL